MKNKSPAGSHNISRPESDWIKERQAAHLAAFQEVRRMDSAELSALLLSLAEESAERAGDLTCHDEAMPELMREAACRYAAAALATLSRKR